MAKADMMKHTQAITDQASPDRAFPRVSLRGVTKRFRTSQGEHIALDHIWLDVEHSEFLVLLGPSGCGKTTLLRCVAGLEMPDEGEILINGKIVFSAEKGIWVPPEQRHLSMVFQSYALWPHMSIFDNIAFPLRNIGYSKADIQTRVSEVLAIVGLSHAMQSYPGQLSGGQQQRVALARAIAWKTDLVLFDEPLSNLDAKVRERLRIELKNIQSGLKFSGLYVTHDQSEAMALADRIVVMNNGKIAQTGRPLEIYTHPGSHYVADFIGSTNQITGRIRDITADYILLETPLGQLKALAELTEDLQINHHVTLMFRPHHCRRHDRDAVTNVITAQLNHTQFLGIQTDRILNVGELVITLTEFSDEQIEAGSIINFAIDPRHIRIFANNKTDHS